MAFYDSQKRGKQLFPPILRQEGSLSAFEEDFKNTDDNPETTAEQKDLEEKLKLAMGKLKSNYRDILALKFYSGMSNEEIAQMLNISASNVGTIINRAVNKLRILLEAEHVA